MSKHWKPNKATVELAPSRIRRAPPPREQTILRRTDEQETWLGAAGVILIASALGIVILGLGMITIACNTAEPNRAFLQCYQAGTSDCVVDGNTLRLDGEMVTVAGLSAPRIQGAGCRVERESGIAAAIALSDLMRSGEVKIGPPLRGSRDDVRPIMINGRDIASAMIESGHGRRDIGAAQDWCSS